MFVQCPNDVMPDPYFFKSLHLLPLRMLHLIEEVKNYIEKIGFVEIQIQLTEK